MFSRLTNATLGAIALHCIKLCSICQDMGYPIGVSHIFMPVGLEPQMRVWGARGALPVADTAPRASGSGHEIARRQWRSQGQSQCVLRSVNEEGALSPTRTPSIANGRCAMRPLRRQGAHRITATGHPAL